MNKKISILVLLYFLVFCITVKSIFAFIHDIETQLLALAFLMLSIIGYIKYKFRKLYIPIIATDDDKFLELKCAGLALVIYLIVESLVNNVK